MENCKYASAEKPWLKYYSDKAKSVCVPAGSIYEYILNVNRENMDDIAINYLGKRITYKQLFSRIDMVADAFYALGVRSGDVVPIALPNIPANIYCMYALNKIGAIGDFIDLRSKGEKLIQLLNDSNAKIAVISDIFADNAFEIQADVAINKWIIASPFDEMPILVRNILKLKARKKNYPAASLVWKDFLKNKQVAWNECASAAKDAPACIFHTSGTTGAPKGVLMSNGNMNAMTIHYKYGNIPCEKGDSFLNQIPPFLAYNEIFSVHVPLALQMSIVLIPTYEPNNFLKYLHKYRPSHVTSGPADLRSFNDSKLLEKVDFSRLKTIACGSDKLDFDKKNNLNKIIKNRNGRYGIMEGYGMTEAGSAIVTCWPNAEKPGSVGIPHFMNVVSIFSEEKYDQELQIGETGEICVYGPTVMSGYYNNENESAVVLKVHSDGQCWLHTGDLGHMDEDGFVYIDGRIKRLIIRHDGIKVSPFEIEQIVKKVRDVKDVCVVGTRDTCYDSGEVPTVYIVADNDSDIKEILSKVEMYCEEELTENYRPHFYRYIDALPLTPNGKVDYRLLTEMSNQEYENEA